MKTFPVLVASLSLLTGCATNNFSKFYRDKTAGVDPALLSQRLEPYSGQTQIFSSNDVHRDVEEMLRRGYYVIGESAFWASGNNTDAQLKEQATAIGADVVIYATKYLGSSQAYVPLLHYEPGQTSTTYSSGNANINVNTSNGGSALGTVNANGFSTTTSPGTFSSTVVPVTVQRYDYDAIFWRKGKPLLLGVKTANLSQELRQSLKRNTGALITTVIDDTPAFRANILPNDILTAVDDTPIYSSQDFTTKMPTFAGKDVVLTLLRDEKEIKISVKLNAANQSVGK